MRNNQDKINVLLISDWTLDHSTAEIAVYLKDRMPSLTKKKNLFKLSSICQQPGLGMSPFIHFVLSPSIRDPQNTVPSQRAVQRISHPNCGALNRSVFFISYPIWTCSPLSVTHESHGSTRLNVSDLFH